MTDARHELGRNAEDLVASWLEDRGFLILGRNVRLGHLEIDIVARCLDLVVVVEVRARGLGAFERPLASLASRKRMRVVQAAERLWRLRIRSMRDVRRYRIDAASVDLRTSPPRIEYVEGAFTG